MAKQRGENAKPKTYKIKSDNRGGGSATVAWRACAARIAACARFSREQAAAYIISKAYGGFAGETISGVNKRINNIVAKRHGCK